ncbi:hypothetical protein BDP27DRAFT_1430171 [Rhodocollybia butyracea]|uniref:Uncharacterized protein n=1 Tax=Rhodocollybia butyracea TaxID=206335 RepID=A0A9P5TYD6_9AGAR|nr:hypothetical protein BDP27DRAFT_1430171 [Rhodocollybia butyracea]
MSADRFISAYDADGRATDFPYPYAANGLPELPKRIVDMQTAQEINLFCAHRLCCKVWYVNPTSSFLCCPNQKNHCCGLYLKIDDIHAPLLKEYRVIQTKPSGPYPSPPASRKRPSVNSETNTTPTKRQKKLSKVPESPDLSTTATATSNPPSLYVPKGSYFTSPPLELKGPLLPDANDDEIISFFTDLKDATVGMKGTLIYDDSRTSVGILTHLPTVDIAVIIQQLRDRIFPGTRAELMCLIQDVPGAGIGRNNEMIGPPPVLATGLMADNPIDVDSADEICVNCSWGVDSDNHWELCFGMTRDG